MTQTWRLFAMDTHFYNSLGSYALETRCEMLRELEYQGTYLTLWNDIAWEDLSRLADVAQAHDLAIAGVYAVLDVGVNADVAPNTRLFDAAPALEGLTRVELAVRNSADRAARYDPGQDDGARRLVEALVNRLPNDVEIAFYPHLNMWLERFEDAIVLCDRIAHERVGVVFPAFHWYAIDGGAPAELFRRAGGRLRSVNLCGSRRAPDGGATTIEPLDEGELDNFALLGCLRRAGYAGMIGVQGYGMGGDCYSKLQRSIAAFRALTCRLDAHPRWADLRPDLVP